MSLFLLEKRLAVCASMVRKGAALADVGTDHAFLPVWLAKCGIVPKAVASDIRPGPLQHAACNIEKYGVGSIVEPRLSNGLDGIRPDEADDVVIAGMGGLMISDIIKRAQWLKDSGKHLILQPMTREEALRSSLAEQGFYILRERAVQEGRHIYTAMLSCYNPKKVDKSDIFQYIGRLSPNIAEDAAYMKREMQRLWKHANGLKLEGDEKRAEELFHIRSEIEKMLSPELHEREE